MHLNGFDSYEQGLGDVAVAHSAGSNRRDPVLGGCESVNSGEAGSADARAGCLQLLRRAVAQRPGACLAGDRERGLEWQARFRATIRATQRSAVVVQRLRVLEA
jgi:hypothetical protein